MPDGAVFVVLKVFKGLCWRGRYRGEDGKDKIVEDKKQEIIDKWNQFFNKEGDEN